MPPPPPCESTLATGAHGTADPPIAPPATPHTGDPSISTYYHIDDENVAWRVADDEAVLLHADSSAYFGLNATGTRLWATLAERPMTLHELTEWARQCFADAPPDVEDVLASFLAELGAHTLIVTGPRRGEAGPPSDEHEVSAVTPVWEPPTLERFGELEKLILSGE